MIYSFKRVVVYELCNTHKLQRRVIKEVFLGYWLLRIFTSVCAIAANGTSFRIWEKLSKSYCLPGE